MKSSKTNKDLKNMLKFDNEFDEIEHESKMLMFKFLSHIELEMDKQNMSKKDLAEKLGTSASYITQLFRGTKTINLLTIAKLQKLFDIEFKISMTKDLESINTSMLKARRTKRKSLINA